MHLLVLSYSPGGGKTLLPALEFLDHTLASARLSEEPPRAPVADLVVLDATEDLARASQSCRLAAAERPVLVVIPAGGLAALKAGWGFADWVAPDASPAEVETRIRLAVERFQAERTAGTTIGDLDIDEDTYGVRLRGRPLDLTFREFELLLFLARNPGRVFSREHLLREVWGYDYYGGSRTVDVHIRRLRAKLGADHEQLIGTVRGVGYKLDPSGAGARTGEEALGGMRSSRQTSRNAVRKPPRS